MANSSLLAKDKQNFGVDSNQILSSNQPSPTTSLELFDLNDDCLLAIFKHLTLYTKIQFGYSSKRLKNLLFIYLRANKQQLEINFDETEWHFGSISVLFKIIGQYCQEIQIIECSLSVNILISFIKTLCPNLRALHLNGILRINNNFYCFEKLIRSLENDQLQQQLERLELPNCSLRDSDITVLTNLQYLLHLNLSQNKELTGLQLNKFTKLKTLMLSDCHLITTDRLIGIFENLKGLEHLEILRINCSDWTILKICNNCKKLVTLKFCAYYGNVENFQKLTDLKKLQHLTIMEKPPIHGVRINLENIKRFRQIIVNVLHDLCDQLITLGIYIDFNDQHCCDLNERRFKALQNMSKLKQLDLYGYLIMDWKQMKVLEHHRQLKVINLNYFDSKQGFSSPEFLEFTVNVKCIEAINISYQDKLEEKTVICDFIKELKAQKIAGNLKLKNGIVKIDCYTYWRVKEEILNNPEYKDVQDLFHLKMEAVCPLYSVTSWYNNSEPAPKGKMLITLHFT